MTSYSHLFCLVFLWLSDLLASGHLASTVAEWGLEQGAPPSQSISHPPAFCLGTASGPLQATQSAALLESLNSRVAALEEKFHQDPQWGELQRLRAEICKEAWWVDPGPNPPWTFTAQVLLLLLCLKRCMVLLAAGYCPPSPDPKGAEAAPPLSPDTLSISQEKTVQVALQLVATLGLCPYLLPGVGLPLRHRTEFSALVQHVVSPGSTSGATRRLYATCTILLEIAQHPSLGSLLLTRHLGDLLAGLCQLAFGPPKRKGDQAKLQKEQTVSSLPTLTSRGCTLRPTAALEWLRQNGVFGMVAGGIFGSG